MAARIVVFGATGYTGRLVAEALVAAGERPLLAGRSAARLDALAERLGGLDTRVADAARPSTVFDLLERGDALVTTVGPFARHGAPAARAAIAAGGVYLDSTGEPAFIRRVFEELGPPAARAGATLLTAMGYDYVPGQLAGALALRDAGPDAVRVDVGYYALGGGTLSAGTRASSVGIVLDPSFELRDGALREARNGARVRSFAVRGRDRPAISIGGAEHFGLPAFRPGLREVNVYLGWFGPLARPLQGAALVAGLAARVPGVRGALELGLERLAGLARDPEPGVTSGALSWIVAEALDADGRVLARADVGGADPYAFTGAFLAWAARRAVHHGVAATGAASPLAAFDLEALAAGCAEAGLRRVDAA